MNRTRAAKVALRLATLAARVRMPRRLLTLDWPEDGEPTFTPAGWHLGPPPVVGRLLRWSMRLDPVHWDHWATVHTACGGIPCPKCGGVVCAAER